MREIVLLIFLKQEFLRIKIMHLKEKKKKQRKNQKKTNFSNILRTNQRVLTIICLKNISILKHLLFWQKKLCETKDKKKKNDLVELIKIRWSNLKDEIKEMSKEKIEHEKPDKILKIVEEILKFNKQK